MKKFFITMLAAVVATASFAQTPKYDKEITATKSYEAGLKIYNDAKESMDPEMKQKAALALNKLADAEAKPAIENVTAGKATNADNKLIANMISAAFRCKKVGAKGGEDIFKNVQNFRPLMINAANNTNDNDEKLMYALTYIKSAEANDQFAPLASFFAAYANYNKEDFANAAKYAKSAIGDERVHAQAEQIYCMSLEKTMKTREDSLKYVDALKELDVNKYFFQIFNIYNSIGMQDKIQILIDESLAKDPNNKTAYLVRGTLKGEKQDYKSALEDFKKVVEIDPDYIHGWFNLSKCYGNIADDIQLKKADKSGRLFGDDLKACSEAYEGAADALEHVRTLDPNHETIDNWPRLLRMYYNRMGKTDKAKEISKIIGDE